VTRLAREFPDIDILVNNAGAIPGGKLLDIDEATWRAAWDLKVFGYINMCRAFYALMKTRRAGVIINVVGNAAQTHDPDYAGTPSRVPQLDRVAPDASRPSGSGTVW
jgi:3-oxoacyl-[acyl-carrier protein] reductase